MDYSGLIQQPSVPYRQFLVSKFKYMKYADDEVRWENIRYSNDDEISTDTKEKMMKKSAKAKILMLRRSWWR